MKEFCETGEESLANFQPNVELGEIEDIPKLIETFHQLELGRSIMITSEEPTTHKSRRQLAGYILPTSTKTESLIVLNSGEIYLVTPPSNDPDDISTYKRFHDPSPLAYHYTSSTDLFEEGTEGLVHFINTGRLSNKISLSNRYGPSEELNEKIAEAVNTAFYLREQRIQGLEDSRKVILKKGVNGPNFTPVPQEHLMPPFLGSSEKVIFETTADEGQCIVQ